MMIPILHLSITDNKSSNRWIHQTGKHKIIVINAKKKKKERQNFKYHKFRKLIKILFG